MILRIYFSFLTRKKYKSNQVKLSDIHVSVLCVKNVFVIFIRDSMNNSYCNLENVCSTFSIL